MRTAWELGTELETINGRYEVRAITPHGSYEFEIIDVLVDDDQQVVRLKLSEIARKAEP